MAVNVWLLIFLSSAILIAINGQIPIPNRPQGFLYKSGKVDAPIQFDVYMGPLCPDSRVAFPTIKEVADSYGPDKLRLKMHLFPLPYHHNAYVVAQGIHAVDVLSNQAQTFNFTRHVYENLLALYQAPTIQDVMTKLAESVDQFGIQRSQFEALITKREIDMDCRTEFKHGCTRGVAETPTFMINDIKVQDAKQTWLNADWRILIEGLLQSGTGKSMRWTENVKFSLGS